VLPSEVYRREPDVKREGKDLGPRTSADAGQRALENAGLTRDGVIRGSPGSDGTCHDR
jgi:hypothetical protein